MKTKWSKKKTIILIIAIVVIVVALFIGVAVMAISALSKGMPVEVTTVSQGSIAQELDYSGTVMTEETKVYFAPVSGKVETVDVTIGDAVKAGDSLLSYDIEELEEMDELAALQVQADNYGINATMTSITDTQNKQAEAVKNYDEAMQYVYHYSGCLEKANAQYAEAMAVKTEYDTLKATVDQYKIKQGEYDTPNAELAALISEGEAKLAALQQKMSQYDYAGLENSISICSANMNEYKALAQQYEAQKDNNDPALASQKAQQSTLREINALNREQAAEDLATARAGVRADFNGVITTVETVEGQTVSEGMQLFTLESTEKLKVNITLTKYDLDKLRVGQVAIITINGVEYTGTVTKINGMAQTNANGASTFSADVHIDNPGEGIFLGTEAKVNITSDTRENVLMVPVACVNYDTQGTFCYVIDDGILTRRTVEVGITSDEYIEIVNGLHTEDQIITKVTPGMAEGMKVTPMEAVE